MFIGEMGKEILKPNFRGAASATNFFTLSYLCADDVSIGNMKYPKIEARLAADESLNGRADLAENVAVGHQDHSTMT